MGAAAGGGGCGGRGGRDPTCACGDSVGAYEHGRKQKATQWGRRMKTFVNELNTKVKLDAE